MRYVTCSRCGCEWNPAGNLVCRDCHRTIRGGRRRRVAVAPAGPVASLTGPPLPAPETRMPFGPRQGLPLSVLRMEAEGLTPVWVERLFATMMILAAAAALLAVVLVVLRDHPWQ